MARRDARYGLISICAAGAMAGAFLLITSKLDALRGEGEAYAEKLMEAGVTVTFTRYLGVLHDFVMLNGANGYAATRAAIAQANAMLRRALAA
jgi:acetyl esterase